MMIRKNASKRTQVEICRALRQTGYITIGTVFVYPTSESHTLKSLVKQNTSEGTFDAQHLPGIEHPTCYV